MKREISKGMLWAAIGMGAAAGILLHLEIWIRLIGYAIRAGLPPVGSPEAWAFYESSAIGFGVLLIGIGLGMFVVWMLSPRVTSHQAETDRSPDSPYTAAQDAAESPGREPGRTLPQSPRKLRRESQPRHV